jgi:chemosensory pili system protein ChpA (sensor histidine kinase/response regulator)
VVEIVRRATAKELQQAYNSGTFEVAGESLPFYWSGALLQSSARSNEPQGKTLPVVIFRSAAQRIAVHVDEVLGNQEVVVKNLGPQLARLPGLAGMTVLASGAVVLIYNPVALSTVYGEQARRLSADEAQPEMLEQAGGVLAEPGQALAPVQPVMAAPPHSAGDGGGRFHHRAPRDAAPAAARGLPGRAGRRWPAGTGAPGRRAAHRGAVRHRNAAHGRL